MTQRRPTNGNGHHGHANGNAMPKWLPQIVFGVAVYSLAITFAGAWWASAMQTGMAVHDRRLDAHDVSIAASNAKGDRIAVLETQIGHIQKTLEKIETALSRNLPRPRS